MNSNKKKQKLNKNGNNPRHQNSFNGQSQFNYAPQSYDLFICNYPRDHDSPEAILGVLNKQVYSSFGAYANFFNPSRQLDGFKVSVLNHIQYDAVLQLNGSFVYDYPIWIINFPSNDALASQCSIFSLIFKTFTTEGITDLSDFANTLEKYNGNSSIVNFNNREFVEFLLFRLGTDSRDRRFWVSSLMLNNNGITSIAPWASFFHFLPNLKYINLNGNPIRNPEEDLMLPKYLQISIDFSGNTFSSYNGGGTSLPENPYQAPMGKNKKQKWQQQQQTNTTWGNDTPEANYPPLDQSVQFPTVNLTFD